MIAKGTVISYFSLSVWLICALLPQRVLACECSISAIFTSDPADGAEDVPLNAGFLFSGALSAARGRERRGRGIHIPGRPHFDLPRHFR